MAELARGERMIQIFVYLMTHNNNRYTISEIMNNLDIPEQDLRSVQRDMVSLQEMPENFIQRFQVGRSIFYQANMPKASTILFSNFEEILLQFVFLRRIACIYPAAASLVTDLVEKIKCGLPLKIQDDIDSNSKSLNERILFMGTPPEFDDEIDKKLSTILKAISKSRKILVKYTDNFDNTTEKNRTPLMIIIDHGELYVACVSESHPGKTYVLKLRRIESVQLTKETFVPRATDLNNIRERVRSGGMLFGEQSPNCEDISIYFPKYARNYLAERPYNRTMKIKQSDKYTIHVTMKAEVNNSLVQWVLRNGATAEVEKPDSLKHRIIDSAKAIIDLYREK
ncbi:MAG: WYL domain-containing protein [Fibrobacter sp.]|nr:WYL domain-containing protein [Fibrobacter sp.]